MNDFETFTLCEKVNKNIEPDELGRQEEIDLANIFNRKHGRGFLNSVKVEFAKDDNGKPLYIGFEDTAHFKARMTQRHSDMSPKDIKRLIKTIGLGAYREKEELFHTGHEFSVLVFSKSKKIGVYVKFKKNTRDKQIPYIFNLITVLPKGKDETSRDSDMRLIVEKVTNFIGTIFVE